MRRGLWVSRLWWVFGLWSLVILASGAHAQPLQDRMRAAEDARVTAARDMAPLLAGLKHRDPAIVLQAVRALGRLERLELVQHILPLVTHARADIRKEAVNALGQSLAPVPRGRGQDAPLPGEAATVSRTLLERLRTDSDPYAVGVAAETLGRLPYRSTDAVREAEEALAALLPGPRAGHPGSLTGAVKGLETLIRVHGFLRAPGDATVAGLRRAATLAADPSDGDFAYIRRLAWLALNGAAAADVALVARGLDDPDPQVRRLAVLALNSIEGDDDRRRALLKRALPDASFIVRYEAVRVYSRAFQSSDCAPVLAAVDDGNSHVTLAAIDALGNGCPEGVQRLIELADALPDEGPNWHRAAHAMVSLAKTSREAATPRLARFGEHSTWQVRMYAARAAAVLAASARLERLAADRHDNVREAAITGLVPLRGHDADGLYIAALARSDYQLVLTAARALEHSPNAERAVPGLVSAFARLTAQRRDTSRDPRLAILARLAELGTSAHAPVLKPCLADFDPVVAARCAEMLTGWTGAAHITKVPPRPVVPVPADAAQRARITMARGGSFELRLFPDEAPVTVARFARLARDGYYNGLTFHRVVPNFVIQGGSPGANEYMGDGPYMCDELGLRAHRRGTLGISTRGRDTGDAQIFINLLDNPRLDHNYTVFAEVTTGLDVVDGILEGDVIDRVDILEPPATGSGR